MRNRRLATIVAAVALVAAVLAEWAAGETSPFPGQPAVIGLFGCIGIIVISKALGKAFLQRAEDYYPADEPPDHHEDLRG